MNSTVDLLLYQSCTSFGWSTRNTIWGVRSLPDNNKASCRNEGTSSPLWDHSLFISGYLQF